MAEQIRQLGAGGLNTDTPPMIVPPNTFTDVLNVRFFDDSVQTITGETTGRIVGIAPDFGVHWRRPDQGYNIFAKNGNFVRVDSAGNQSSMFSSNASQYSNSDWQFTYFNGGYAIVFNNGKSTPLYCLYGSVNADSALQPLPNWNYAAGLTVTAKVIRALNYSLVAGNLTISASGTVTYAPGTIRVSVQAPTGGIPQTWQPGLTADTADEFELSSTSPVLDMAPLRGNMFIYTSDSISMLSINQQGQARVSGYSDSYGILNTDCVIEFEGKHFVVDNNDIYIHSGSGEIQSVADGRIKRYFFSNLNRSQINKVQVIRNPFYKEIWINYPKGSSVNCNESLIFNYKTNTWTKRQLANVAWAFNGPSNIANQWQYSNKVIYMTTNTTQTLITDDSFNMWNGSALVSYESYIEKKKLNTGNTALSSLVTSLYPVFDSVPSNSTINIYVKGQNNYTDNITFDSNDLFTFEPNNDRALGYKVDPRINGRVLNFKISSMGNWRMPLYAFEAKPADRR
jgi:hypothetical protein